MANLGYIGHNRTRSKAQWLLDKGTRGLELEKEDCAVLFHVLAKLSGVPA